MIHFYIWPPVVQENSKGREKPYLGHCHPRFALAAPRRFAAEQIPIAEAHRGSISFHSIPEEGTIFSITIPCKFIDPK
ncbi:MAG: HAMP domain-containing histidine kinase [Caldilineaceae bacterium]|nr:HAMP domain-containing histidine kinase [Caldilineaceae bacterium]